MKFSEPLWLLAGLIACGALIWAWWRYDTRQRRALATFAAARLHDQLTLSFSAPGRRWKRGLLLVALAGLFAALARPQAGFRLEEVKRRGIEVIFAVDTSRSMLTPDVKPDRLARAKLAVDDFVGHLDGDGVGLIAFAGNAFLQCPITLDHDAFNESLGALDTTIIPRGGTDIASAIREAQAALQSRPSADRILVLLTDGEDLEGDALEAAKAAAKTGLKIYAVGVGTANGDLIPVPADQGGGFIKDDSGQFVKSHLDEAGLKKIAEATGGLYTPLGAEGQGLDAIYRRALAPLARHDLAARWQKVYTERYQWPLAAALMLLLASLAVGTRRRHQPKAVAPATARAPFGRFGVALMLGLLILATRHQAAASTATAEAAYNKGDFDTAQRDYLAAAQSDARKPELEFNAGAAAYKAGQFPQAAAAFQKSLSSEPSADPNRLLAQENAYYDLGNTLYRSGQKVVQGKPEETIKTWERAIKTYEAALQLRAGDADAKYNRDFVQKRLDALKKQQEQKKQKQDQKDQNQTEPPGQKPDQKNQAGKNEKPGQQNQSGKDSQGKNQENKTARSKDQKEANGNAKPDQQKPSGQKGPEPIPANGQPQNNAVPDQNQNPAPTGDAQEKPGQMSKDEARALLNSLRDEEQRLPAAPVARAMNKPQTDKPIKDW